jgi:hypothetical protein
MKCSDMLMASILRSSSEAVIFQVALSMLECAGGILFQCWNNILGLGIIFQPLGFGLDWH